MGVRDHAALPLAFVASFALVVLSQQVWAKLWIQGEFIGPVEIRANRGTQITELFSIGDGTVILLGALMTMALSLLALIWVDTRRPAGVAVAASGLVMFGIATYDCIQLAQTNGGGTGLTNGGYHMTVVPYLAAALALLVAIAGIIVSDVGRLRTQLRGTRIRLRLPSASQFALISIIIAAPLLVVCSLAPWFSFQHMDFRGQQTQVFSGFGDGYVLAGMALLGAAQALWHLLRGRLQPLAWIALVTTTTVTLAVSLAALTYEGNLCGRDTTVLGFLSGPTCVHQSGSFFVDWGEGARTAFLWTATVLSAANLVAAVVLPFLHGVRNGRSRRSGAWA